MIMNDVLKNNVRRERVVMTFDRGNTLIKASIYKGDRLLDSLAAETLDIEQVSSLIDSYGVESAIYAAVGHTDVRFVESLRILLDGRLLVMTHATPLPVKVSYRSRQTLGLDRVAAVVGGVRRIGAVPFVIADAGTCLTLDYFNGESFMGGNISAGIRMRLNVLHSMTAGLPAVDADGELPAIGVDTSTALRCGAVRGTVDEIAGFIGSLRQEYGSVRLLLCGGDAEMIERLLYKKNIECVRVPDAVGLGLAAILEYNEYK